MRSLLNWLPLGQPSPAASGPQDDNSLARILAEALWEWSLLRALPSQTLPEQDALEACAEVDAETPFILVLRCDRSAAAEVARAATGDPGAGSEAAAALRELCRLAAAALAEDQMKDGGPEARLELRPCRAEERPAWAPSASACLQIGAGHLEAQLWTLPPLPLP
jgi:hypothetical protein